MLLLSTENWLASLKHKNVKSLGTVVATEGRGILRSVRTIVFTIAALILVGGIVLVELPRQGDAPQLKFLTVHQLLAAYDHIQPGTRASQLARFGLDAAATDTQVLSYLGVMERFMPRDSVAFDSLDAGVRNCIEARDRCTALVFHASDPTSAGTTRGFLSTFGMRASAAASTPRVTLLIRNGRVAFKMMSPPASAQRVRSASTQTPSQTTVAKAITE